MPHREVKYPDNLNIEYSRDYYTTNIHPVADSALLSMDDNVAS